jgi:gluconate 2-dehydrogenase gamma chain
MVPSTRRQLLSATAILAASGITASARTVTDILPWAPNEAFPPRPPGGGPLMVLRPEEAAAIDAILSRLIPSDDLGPGAKETGGTLFIDRQLAGPYGGHEWLYMEGPFPNDPLPTQGMQSPLTPRQQYRQGLAALAEYCKATYAGKVFQQLSAAEQDAVLTGLEKGAIALNGANGRAFFALIHANAIEGFFADPIYGGNQGMEGWKLVGFPGTRYDYRDVIDRPNQPYTLPPVAIQGRPDWGKRA